MRILGLLSLLIFSSACAEQISSPSETELLFRGKHQLQRLVQYTESGAQLGGGGFFILGAGSISVSGKAETKQVIKFAWKSNIDGAYIISSVPLERIRVRINSKVTTPYAEFKLYGNGLDYLLKKYGQQELFDDGYILYVAFTVNEKDWPLKIQMPLAD